jgi:hypothetical protein
LVRRAIYVARKIGPTSGEPITTVQLDITKIRDQPDVTDGIVDDERVSGTCMPQAIFATLHQQPARWSTLTHSTVLPFITPL